jgi:excisionase family DNA binding protein
MRHYTDWNHLPLLMSLEEASILLQITPEALRRLCKAGKIPAAQFGKLWRISRDVIRAMVAKGATDGRVG